MPRSAKGSFSLKLINQPEVAGLTSSVCCWFGGGGRVPFNFSQLSSIVSKQQEKAAVLHKAIA